MKLIPDVRIRRYELTYLLPVNLTTDEVRVVQEKITSLIKKHKGTVEITEDWGKKPLAYRIKHKGKSQSEASYTHLVISFDASKVSAFEQEFKHEAMLLRYLLVVAEEPLDNPEVNQA